MKFTLPLPPSVNSMYSQSRSGFRFKTKEAKDWTLCALLTIRQQKYMCMLGPVEVSIKFHFRNSRSDIDNKIKALLDVMTDAKVYKDDSQITKLVVEKFINSVPTKVEIEIHERL